MSVFKVCAVSTLLALFMACGETDPARAYSLKINPGGGKYQANQQVGIAVTHKSGEAVDSVHYLLDGTRLGGSGGTFTLAPRTLGQKTLQARVFSGGESVLLEKDLVLLAPAPPEIYTYEIVNTFPHDPKAFTQGLEFYKDTLYESTGRKGASTLRKVDFRTGEVWQSVALEREYFGEGLTILSDTIYMLTWQNGVGFLFDRKDLRRIGSFNYGKSEEGWGLCNDGESLYKSDGTQRIWKLDPATLQEVGYLQTVTNRSVFNKANELEYVAGKIYANVWQKESMMIIDAGSGAIEGVVNFGGLRKQVTQHRDLDVFNGVAYHPERKTFFVTGKNWDKLFEVKLIKKQP